MLVLFLRAACFGLVNSLMLECRSCIVTCFPLDFTVLSFILKEEPSNKTCLDIGSEQYKSSGDIFVPIHEGACLL